MSNRIPKGKEDTQQQDNKAIAGNTDPNKSEKETDRRQMRSEAEIAGRHGEGGHDRRENEAACDPGSEAFRT